jgi:Tfp pilus assembly protein PilO
MRKLSKEKRDRLILVCFATLGIMATLWLLLIQSERETLKQMRAETLNVVEQIDGTRRLLAQEANFNDTLEGLNGELAQRETGMASGDRFYWFVNMLNKFKSGYTLDIPQISQETVAPVGLFPEFPYQAATFKISGAGTYFEFGRFLKDFENKYPYIRVQNLELKPSRNAEKKEQISFNMDIVTLIKPAA